MHKYILIFLIPTLFCGQEKELEVTLDPTIKEVVEKDIKEDSFTDEEEKTFYFTTSLELKYFENGDVKRSKDKDWKSTFKAALFKKKDTILIEGINGILGSKGFVIKIKDKKVSLFALVKSDITLNYSFDKEGPFYNRLEIPCKSQKLTLSEFPKPTEKKTIYGYVEFESEEFYYKNYLGTKVSKLNMKVYFKAPFFDNK